MKIMMKIDVQRYLRLSVNKRCETVCVKAKSLVSGISLYCHETPEYREVAPSKEKIDQKLNELIDELKTLIEESAHLRALQQSDDNAHKDQQAQTNHD